MQEINTLIRIKMLATSMESKTKFTQRIMNALAATYTPKFIFDVSDIYNNNLSNAAVTVSFLTN